MASLSWQQNGMQYAVRKKLGFTPSTQGLEAAEARGENLALIQADKRGFHKRFNDFSSTGMYIVQGINCGGLGKRSCVLASKKPPLQ